ncbi:hypothetical protein [Streptomyces sp. MMS20-AI2-20]|uniref:hypothetical protein n=1 Tax=Streptomyces sp. MMS20-AI2-20 TaxID=2925835 RepID=UPI001F6153BB|nr:hypothetical protein [Streptomyces sp. MMS20-AI2-20]MCI4143023.1 hypothetical protein [Streptomyces sp. MMS20-AI2-20]
MTLAYSALALVRAILAASLWARRTPAGADRAPRVLEETVTLEDLLRPTAHGVNDMAFCPAERRDTLHAFGDNTRTCWTCRTETPTAVPR